MFVENSHLELMTTDRPVVRTWRSTSKFLLPVPHFNSATQERFLQFVTQSPETAVRQAELHFVPDGQRLTADFFIEGDDYEDALGNTVTAALGGLMCAGLEIDEVQLLDVHMAWLRELQQDATLHVGDAPFQVEEIDTALAFASARMIYHAA